MGAGCLAKLPLPWGLGSGPRDKLLSQGKVWVGRDSLPANLCSSGRAWNPLRPHLPEFQWVPCVSFRPLAEEQDCSGGERVPWRRTWNTPHRLDLLTPRVLGPDSIDPEPQWVLLWKWCPGGCSQEKGGVGSRIEQGKKAKQNRSRRPAATGSHGELWSVKRAVEMLFLQAGDRPFTALCQSETRWDLGPGTLGCSACTWTKSPPATQYKETIRD